MSRAATCAPLLALLACWPAPARGEQPRPAPAYQTTVHGRRVDRALPADDPAGFTTVLELRDPTPGTDLADLLAEVPGLRVRDTGVGGQRTLALRGAGSHQVVVFLDGVRLTPPGGGFVDLSLIDPAHLERAEVRRSGGSVRHGSDALGGALLLATPRLRLRSRTSAAVGYGSFDTVSARVSRGAAVGRYRYLASGSFRRTAGDFAYLDHNGVARARRNNDARGGELLLKADRLIGSRWQVGLLNSLTMAERGAPGPLQWASERARQVDLRDLAALQLRRFDLLLPGDELTISLSHRYGYFRFEEPDPPAVLSRNHLLGVIGRAQLALPLARVGRLDAGLEGRGDWLVPLADVDESRPPLIAGVGDPRRLSIDLWLAGQTRLFSNHLVVAPAVRLATASGFAPTVVSKLGLVVRPFGWSARSALAALELTGNIGRSFRHPSFEEMYLRLDGVRGNAALRPEDALALDVGLRWQRRWLRLEAAYYRRWVENTILFAPVRLELVRADNFSGAIVQGIESALELEPGLCLQLRAAYTLTRSRFGDPPARLPGHPEHRVVGRIGWSGDSCRAQLRRSPATRWLAGLELYAGVTVESAMVLRPLDAVDEEGRALLSAGVAYRYRQLRLAAEGRNLLDKRDAVDSVGYPLAPARLFASLGAAF